METDDSVKSNFFKYRKKPQWVVDITFNLKAVNHLCGCRKIAELLDRLHAQKQNMTVSKSYVYYALCKYQYEVQVPRRMIKHQRPRQLERNVFWGVDLTTVTDGQGSFLPVFVAVDHGSRRCTAIRFIQSKHSVVLLYHLFKSIEQCDKPKSVKTNNEAVFTSFVFKCDWNKVDVFSSGYKRAYWFEGWDGC